MCESVPNCDTLSGVESKQSPDEIQELLVDDVCRWDDFLDIVRLVRPFLSECWDKPEGYDMP